MIKKFFIFFILALLVFISFFPKKVNLDIQNSTNKVVVVELILDGEVILKDEIFPSMKTYKTISKLVPSGIRKVRVKVLQDNLVVMEDSFGFFVLFRQFCYINIEPSQELYIKARMIRFSTYSVLFDFI